MKNFLIFVYCMIARPIVAVLNFFRNLYHRKEFKAMEVRQNAERRIRADRLSNELLVEYINAVQEIDLPYNEQSRIITNYTRKVNQLYAMVK